MALIQQYRALVAIGAAQSPFNATMAVSNAGRVRALPPRRKVAICGAGPGKRLAPTDDPAWEIWSLNGSLMTDTTGRFRADRWFDLHEMHAQSAADLEWIAACPVPIYLVPQAFQRAGLRAHEVELSADGVVLLCRTPICYPLDAIETHYGSYFACSFAYMIALALLDGMDVIGLYGCELAYGTERERTVEYANVSWWLGYAEGHGIEIQLPADSTLGRHPARYGIEYDAEKQAVEQYVTLMRRADLARKIDKTQPYNSATEDWLLKPERPQ